MNEQIHEHLTNLNKAIAEENYPEAIQETAKTKNKIKLKNHIFNKVHASASIPFMIFMTLAPYIFLCRYGLDFVVFPEIFGGDKWTVWFGVCAVAALILPLITASISNASAKKSFDENINSYAIESTNKIDVASSLENQLRNEMRFDNTVFGFDLSAYKIAVSLAVAVVGMVLMVATFNFQIPDEFFGALFIQILVVAPISFIIFSILCMIIKPMYASKYKDGELTELINKAKEQISINIDKHREEKQQQEAEEERAKAEKAENLFNELVKTEPVDESAIRQAAYDGSISACLYLGKTWTQEYKEGRYKNNLDAVELKRIYNIAEKFLSRAKKAGSVEAEIFYIGLQINAGEMLKKDVEKAYYRLQEIKESRNFPEYDDSIDNCKSILAKEMIKDLEKRRSEPVVKNKYCRYYDHGRCQFHVNHYSVALCEHADNPGECSIALTQKAIVYEFD